MSRLIQAVFSILLVTAAQTYEHFGPFHTCTLTIITAESITAAALFETAYTAPPDVEPTITPPIDEVSSSARDDSSTLQASLSQTNAPSSSSTSVPRASSQESNIFGEPSNSQLPPAQTESPNISSNTVPPEPSSAGPLTTTAQSGQSSSGDGEGVTETTESPADITENVQLPSGISVLPSGSGVVLPNGETLRPGSATTVNGIPVSILPTESAIIVGGTETVPLGPSPTDFIVLPNGETLTPGVLTTIAGVPVSLSLGATQIVANGSTFAISTTAPGEVGSYIWSGIGGAATSSSPAQYTGGAGSIPAKMRRKDSFIAFILGAVQILV
ncbi:hypothetical protein N0V90_001553 [Kalmusia sp. IMI 367209]|nr:hypothetical protein N0V90_001553 [Kalmusia sp. IMI 367209]